MDVECSRDESITVLGRGNRAARSKYVSCYK
jgi:hypothetical protein